MDKTEKLTLIEGTFSCDEARAMLMNVFSSKIDFHEGKNFSSTERFGVADENALKRIPELKICMDKILEIITEARAQNKNLIISSDINIHLTDAMK